MAIDTAPAAACGLLAPQTLKELEDAEGACVGSLPDELKSAGGPADSAEVYGQGRHRAAGHGHDLSRPVPTTGGG